jgi:transcriptional regulator with XRE-family HTH domain
LVFGTHDSAHNQAMLDRVNLTGIPLAARLKKAMREVGITHAELAEAAEVSTQAVDGWLRTGQIARDRLPAVARALNKSIDWLLTEQDTIHAGRNFPALNIGVLTRAISDFEAAALSAKKNPTSDIKAEAIAWLYENYLATGKPDSYAATRILRLVK